MEIFKEAIYGVVFDDRKQEGNIERREEIVRCRDCRFCMAYMAGAYCDYMAHAIEPDGFCAWGERRY